VENVPSADPVAGQDRVSGDQPGSAQPPSGPVVARASVAVPSPAPTYNGEPQSAPVAPQAHPAATPQATSSPPSVSSASSTAERQPALQPQPTSPAQVGTQVPDTAAAPAGAENESARAQAAQAQAATQAQDLAVAQAQAAAHAQAQAQAAQAWAAQAQAAELQDAQARAQQAQAAEAQAAQARAAQAAAAQAAYVRAAPAQALGAQSVQGVQAHVAQAQPTQVQAGHASSPPAGPGGPALADVRSAAGSAAAVPPPPAGGVKRRRRGLVAALVLIPVLLVALAGVVVVRPGPVDGWLAALTGKDADAAPPAQTIEALPGPVLAALNGGVLPDLAALKAALDPLVTGSALGGNVGVSVVDIESGAPLYERRAGNLLVPASNMKIITAAAVLATRGPDYRITTRVVAGTKPGEVVLIGAGDATLAVDANAYYAGAPRLDQLAEQVRKALGGTAPTSVVVDGSLFSGPLTGPAWDSNDVPEGWVGYVSALMLNGSRTDPKDRSQPYRRFTDNERGAGEAFARLFGLPASAVSKGTAPPAAVSSAPATTGAVSPSATGSAPAAVQPGAELGAVHSAPMLRQIEQMLHESDNTLADTLARQVALVKGKPATFSGTAAAMTEALQELGLPTDQVHVADASGFSKENQVTATLLTSLLHKAASGDSPLGDLLNTLAVAGWSGTMSGRFEEQLGAYGVVRAKSGSLNYVNSIAGLVHTADGRLLAFAVLANDVPVNQLDAHVALDAIVARIAACGC
jgi:D-alanyl-D-alanine carboxypeptidase/D-alanyl-D-alanine-endopeptidase (penicillin-binding protein 4)